MMMMVMMMRMMELSDQKERTSWRELAWRATALHEWDWWLILLTMMVIFFHYTLSVSVGCLAASDI